MRCDRLLVVGILLAMSLAPVHAESFSALRSGDTEGTGQASVVYDPYSGELAFHTPAGVELTSLNIDSAGSIFTGEPAQNLGGSFDNDSDNNIFKAAFGSSFGSLSFGTVAQWGLSCGFVVDDLTAVGSIDGGGDLGDVDIVCFPEPSTVVLAALGTIWLMTSCSRMTQRWPT